MKLSDEIKKSSIKLSIESYEKNAVLEELVHLLCDSHKLKDREKILEAILRREARQSTGVGMGLAVPHAKTPVVDRLYICAALSPRGIEFDSVDGEKTHIFFLLVSPINVSGPHIKALAGISRLIKNEEFRTSIIGCRTVKEFIKTVKDFERRLL